MGNFHESFSKTQNKFINYVNYFAILDHDKQYTACPRNDETHNWDTIWRAHCYLRLS